MGERIGLNYSKINNTTKCPCRECTDRHQACHSECEKYNEWLEARREIRSGKDVEYAVSEFWHDIKHQHYKKSKKFNGGR